jgi:hypothetical protein
MISIIDYLTEAKFKMKLFGIALSPPGKHQDPDDGEEVSTKKTISIAPGVELADNKFANML